MSKDWVITLAVALATLAAADAVASRFVGRDVDLKPAAKRAPGVVGLPNVSENVPPPVQAPSVIVIGNSHTYALPGLAKGDGLRPDPGATLIDELAARVRATSSASTAFYLLSAPNFLPVEMLIRSVDLIERGYQPNVVVIGVCWRNIARGVEIRHAIRRVMARPEIAAAMAAAMESTQAPAALAELYTATQKQALKDAASASDESGRSLADVVDRRLMSELGDRVTLLGSSATIRARAYRSLIYAIEGFFVGDAGVSTNPAVIADLELNRAALVALIRLYESRGAHVIAYQTPERADVPPIVETKLRDGVMAEIEAELAKHGGTLINARDVVPLENWGWERDTRDASHFTEPGHSLLADLLSKAGGENGAWTRLRGTM